MNIAAIMSDGAGRLDGLLARTAALMIARGLRPAGLVQFNKPGCAGPRCDMDVQVLPAGPVFRISQSLGAGARGCRLDPAALEAAVAAVTADLAGTCPALLIVNKFGKHEAEGRGFAGLIGDALADGIPVLVGVNALNRGAFEAYAGGMAILLPPDVSEILHWVARTCTRSTAMEARA